VCPTASLSVVRDATASLKGDGMKSITDAQEGILKYLAKEKKFVSPTNIGLAFGCSYESASPWASPRCLGLVKKGLLVRSNKGHYAIKGEL